MPVPTSSSYVVYVYEAHVAVSNMAVLWSLYVKITI